MYVMSATQSLIRAVGGERPPDQSAAAAPEDRGAWS
jgi:hypothetical protein